MFYRPKPGRYHMIHLPPSDPDGSHDVAVAVPVTFGARAVPNLSRVDFRAKRHPVFGIISTRIAPVVAVMVLLYPFVRSLDLVGSLPGLILPDTTFNLPVAIWILKRFFDNAPLCIEPNFTDAARYTDVSESYAGLRPKHQLPENGG